MIDSDSLFIKHHYGERVHLLHDVFHHSLLAKLCHPQVHQPEINRMVERLYKNLLTVAVNKEFDQEPFSTATRMTAAHPTCLLSGVQIKPTQKIVCVDLMRAGIYPTQICYEELHWLISHELIRQDHLSVARVADEQDKVTRMEMGAHKIGGDIKDAFVFFPDPMGATGTTIISTIDFYKKHIPGPAKRFIALHLIVTPEYLSRVLAVHKDIVIYAFRVDRGLSPQHVLAAEPGKFWSQERGLNEKDYIVPGAGGFGEIMNNSFV